VCSISFPFMLEGKDRIIPNLECQSYMILSFLVLNNAMLSATGKMQSEIRYLPSEG
jgi:hypothetical protein